MNTRERKTYELPRDFNDDIFYGLELNEEQKVFANAILDENVRIVFCDSKAGTGKTVISMGVANLLYHSGKYSGILYVVAPVQERALGYLPGSEEEKIAPYKGPLLDALETLNIDERAIKSELRYEDIKTGVSYIEMVPHTYMRGKTLSGKVIIIDEAENFYGDELKKVLTRIKDDCKVIVIGHDAQCDLVGHTDRSGFVPYVRHFEETHDPRVAVCKLTKNYRGFISRTADELIFSDWTSQWRVERSEDEDETEGE